ncbi:glutamate-1-semialdehyde 2,1-aminomutase [Granulicella pectinivorans]|uniref:Glutamate-1-semialdehyde 2,1-aminomutase n=1 Tax=Granulicella pectinivorans TaxID=474950 RepID=A0A1I6L573_9BACT|nr:aspartate aminotransferase family protein [Granulicella pectinivorans]SFR98592.1 glutamate-1-semialdehyde 2,1-aminomutase [Granulicella pectinivorans]
MSERYARSIADLERSKKSLAGGVSSNVRLGDKPFPLFFERGTGSHLWDVDGNEYIDYVLGRGPLLLGHTPPEVIQATCDQMWRGQIYAAQHELEFELSERVSRIVPCADLVRFGISGSEAVHGALRLARAATGRQTVLKFEGQYHGWLDNILYSLSPDPNRAGDALHPAALAESAGQFSGTESHVVVLPWNNIPVLEEYLAQHGTTIAAIITEPVMCNTAVIPPLPGYLEALRDLCTQYGIVLIFDEVITGFRLSLAGAQGRFNVKPDLTIFGKAIANGMPISCLAGREQYMGLIAAGKVGHGGTYNSLPPAVAGAIATLDMLERDGAAVYATMERTGGRLMDGIKQRAAKLGIPVVVQGYGPIFYMGFPTTEVAADQAVYDYRSSLAMDQELYTHFVSAMVDRGVRIIPRGNWFLSSTHSDADIDQTLDAVEAVLAETIAPKLHEKVTA